MGRLAVHCRSWKRQVKTIQKTAIHKILALPGSKLPEPRRYFFSARVSNPRAF